MILAPLFFTILLTSIEAIKFQTQIKHYQRICFSQFITQSTPFHFKVSAPQGNFQFSLSFLEDKILQKNSQPSQNVKKVSSYAAVNAQYNFCVDNLGQTQNFTFEFMQGLQISDKIALPAQEEHKTLQKTIDQVNRQYQVVKEQEHYSFTVNEFNMELQKMVSFKAVGFGFLSITVVIIIGFLNFLQIKRVLRNRKII